MKTLVVCFVAFFLSASAHLWAQGTISYTQFGTSAEDTVNAISAASDAVYVAGYTWGTLPGQTNAGEQDAFLSKYDLSGNLLWTRQFGGPGIDTATAVCAFADAVYVAGTIVTVFDGVFVSKYDPNGNLIWTRQFGGGQNDSSYDYGYGLSVISGAVYVVGIANGALPGQVSLGQADAFVRKYDSDGNELWTRQFGSSEPDYAFAVSATADTVYVVGDTDGALPGQRNRGGQDGFVQAFSSDGTALWNSQVGDAAPLVTYFASVSATADALYVGGSTTSYLGSIEPYRPMGAGDALLAKYDFSGNEVWTRQFGPINSNFALAVAATSDDSIYLAGATYGALVRQVGAGSADAFVGEFNFNGVPVWWLQFGTSAYDRVNGVSVLSGIIYVGGFTDAALPGQTYAGGSSDAYLARINPSATSGAGAGSARP